MTSDAEKREHGTRLKTAMARNGWGRADLATELGVSPETVTNWRSGRTMPDLRQLHRLADILGAYNAAGDQVELAILGSELTEDRQYDVIGYYKRRLREQRESREVVTTRAGQTFGRMTRETDSDRSLLAASDEDYSIADEAEETERST